MIIAILNGANSKLQRTDSTPGSYRRIPPPKKIVGKGHRECELKGRLERKVEEDQTLNT